MVEMAAQPPELAGELEPCGETIHHWVKQVNRDKRQREDDGSTIHETYRSSSLWVARCPVLVTVDPPDTLQRPDVERYPGLRMEAASSSECTFFHCTKA